MQTIRISFVLIWIFFLFAAVDVVAAEKKALLVGINDYKYIRDLEGTGNDVELVKTTLINKYGFSNEDITVLLDSQATKKNIINAFRENLILETQPGDIAVFYFSGHGTCVQDYNNDENDGADEGLIPYDFISVSDNRTKSNLLVLDDTIGDMLNELNGREVVVIIDSCFSGTATRSIGNDVVSNMEDTPAYTKRYLPCSKPTNVDYTPQSRSINNSLEFFEVKIPEGHVYMSASRDDQVAREAYIDGKRHGIFTKSLVTSMNSAENDSYQDIFENASQLIRDKHKNVQEPQLFPNSGRSIEKSAFSYATNSQPVNTQNYSDSDGATPQNNVNTKYLTVYIDEITGANRNQFQLLKSSIGKIPFVKIVTTKNFDRMIKGIYSDGKYSIRILNKFGDKIALTPTGNLSDLVVEMAPNLEYALIAKKLSALENQDSDLKVQIDVADGRRDFRKGEKIVYNIKCNKNCYLYVINADSQGNVNLMFPNRFNQNNLVAGQTQIELPTHEMRIKDFEFQVFPPLGEETVKVIASNRKLDLQSFDLNNFEAIFQTVQGSPLSIESRSRNFADELTETITELGRGTDFEWGEDTIVMRSYN